MNRTKNQPGKLEEYKKSFDILLDSNEEYDKVLANILKCYIDDGYVGYWNDFGKQCKLVNSIISGEKLIVYSMDDVNSWHNKALDYLQRKIITDKFVETHC